MDTLENATKSAHDKAVRFQERLDDASRMLSDATGDVASAMATIRADHAVVIQVMQGLNHKVLNVEEELRQESASILGKIASLEHVIRAAHSDGTAEAAQAITELRELMSSFAATDERVSTFSQPAIQRLENAEISIAVNDTSGASRLTSLETLVNASAQKVSSASEDLKKRLSDFDSQVRDVLLSAAEAELAVVIETFYSIKDDCVAQFSKQEHAVKDEIESLLSRVEQRLSDELEHVVGEGEKVAGSVKSMGASLSNDTQAVMRLHATTKTSLSTATTGLESIASIMQDLREIFQKVV